MKYKIKKKNKELCLLHNSKSLQLVNVRSKLSNRSPKLKLLDGQTKVNHIVTSDLDCFQNV